MQPGTKPPLLAILLLWLVTALCAVRPSQTELASGARFKRSDDRSPLETVVEQQAALIQTLQAKVTALETDTAALKSRQQALSSPGKDSSTQKGGGDGGEVTLEVMNSFCARVCPFLG